MGALLFSDEEDDDDEASARVVIERSRAERVSVTRLKRFPAMMIL